MKAHAEIRFLPALKVMACIFAVAPAVLLAAVLRYGGGFLGGTASWAAPTAAAVLFLFLALPSVFLYRSPGAWFLRLPAWIVAGIVLRISEHVLDAWIPYHDSTASFLAVIPMVLALCLSDFILKRIFLRHRESIVPLLPNLPDFLPQRVEPKDFTRSTAS